MTTHKSDFQEPPHTHGHDCIVLVIQQDIDMEVEFDWLRKEDDCENPHEQGWYYEADITAVKIDGREIAVDALPQNQLEELDEKILVYLATEKDRRHEG